MDVSITDLRANLASHLHEVQNGSEVVITDRGRPIAKMVPIDHADLLDDLESRGIVTRARRPRIPSRAIRQVQMDGEFADIPRGEWR